jgi:hypothetical protein
VSGTLARIADGKAESALHGNDAFSAAAFATNLECELIAELVRRRFRFSARVSGCSGCSTLSSFNHWEKAMTIQTDSAVSTAVIDEVDTHTGGVSWPAVIAGAAAAAALSYALLILGMGLGFASTSPWSYSGAAAGTIGIAAIVWLTFTQIAASGLGGYLAGRLRKGWRSVNNDEVFFRDTAHGFLAWCVASLLVAAFLASAVAGILSGGASIASSAVAGVGAGAGAVAAKAADGSSTEYWADTILRTTTPANSADAPATVNAPSNEADVRAEVGRIFATSLASGSLSAPDRQYLGQLVARRTGVDAAEGEKRVDAAFASAQQSIETAKTKAKQVADDARKATAGLSIWMFLSLLCGAFAASFAATIGGRHRETYVYMTRRV